MPDPTAPLTKRLHISGLTPALALSLSLTPDALSARLAAFGTVRAVDGFGLSDGLGGVRRFGYVTLETTGMGLKRCMGSLSGSTWKGAKLRIGEAKPNFAERLAKERQTALDEPPHKKRKRQHTRGGGGVHADDMTPITPETAATRSGWKVTPMGRVVRPVRMRPERPLPPMDEGRGRGMGGGREEGKSVKRRIGVGKDGDGGWGRGRGEGEGEKKKRKRVKDPPVRARRRTIDVTRWPSVHLKGMFLGMDVVGTRLDGGGGGDVGVGVVPSGGGERDAGDESDTSEMIVEETGDVPSVPSPPPSLSIPAPPTATTALPDDTTDVQRETTQSLALLMTLFGGGDGGDWVGRESVGSDVDEEALMRGQGMVFDGEGGDGDGDVGFEIVPLDLDAGSGGGVGDGGAMEVDVGVESSSSRPGGNRGQGQGQGQATKLKDLFAPGEADAGFSLLGYLDLDLDMELDLELGDDVPVRMPGLTDAKGEYEYAPRPVPVPAVVTSHAHAHTAAPPQLTPAHPLFFPRPRAHTSTTATKGYTKAHPPDPFDLGAVRGGEFFRVGTEGEVRAAWEAGRGELTRGWRRRWREAGKVGRRRGGGGVGAGDFEGGGG